MSKIELTEANYRQMLAAKGPKGLPLDAPIVGAMVAVNGLDPKTGPAAVVQAFGAMYSSRVKADSLSALSKTASETTLKGKGLLALLKGGALWVKQFTETDDKGKVTATPRLSFTLVLADDGESAAVSVSAGQQRSSKGGTVSPNSRKSAYVAWKETKGKDCFKLEVVKGDKNGKSVTTGYHDVTEGKGKRFVKSGELTKYIGSVYPNSLTAATLKKYGQL